jgi:hypothetical protein
MKLDGPPSMMAKKMPQEPDLRPREFAVFTADKVCRLRARFLPFLEREPLRASSPEDSPQDESPVQTMDWARQTFLAPSRPPALKQLPGQGFTASLR